jgi:hypothetical protein
LFTGQERFLSLHRPKGAFNDEHKQGKKYAMKESIINKKLPKIVYGLLFIGGGAFIPGIIRAAKNIDRSYQQVF